MTKQTAEACGECPVTMQFCDSRHRSTKTLNLVVITLLGIIMAGGTTIYGFMLSRQDTVADQATEAMRIASNEQDRNKQAQIYIKEEIGYVRKEVDKINTKQDAMNNSIQRLLQASENRK